MATNGKAIAVARGAGTIINAMATWKGAAFGVDLFTKATVEIIDDGFEIEIKSEKGESDSLARTCVERLLSKFEVDKGAKVKTESNIPIARGMKSSSAAANAITLATLEALGKREGFADLDIMNMSVDACIDARVTMTGAFDDTSASFLGGMQVTDNKKRAILKSEPIPAYDVLFMVGEKKSYSGKMDKEKFKAIGKEVDKAFELAKKGDYWTAMKMNSDIYCKVLGIDPAPVEIALQNKALGAGLSGKGPAICAVCDHPNRKEAVLDAWKAAGYKTIIECKTNNEKASVSSEEKRE